MAYLPTTLVGVLWFVLAGLVVSLAVHRLVRALATERGARRDSERALQRATQLESLATALLKGRTSREVCQACLAELLYALDASAGAIALVADDDSRLEIAHAIGFTDTVLATSEPIALDDHTLLTDVVRRRDPITFTSPDDLLRDFAHLSIDPLLDGCPAAAIVPLLIAGRAVGVVTLTFDHAGTVAFTDRRFLIGAVQRVAHALDRAARYEQAERARADAEAYRERADLELRERQRAEEALRESEAKYRALAARTTRLYTLSAGLSQAVTLEAVSKVIVQQGITVAGASAGLVALLVEGHFETVYADRYPPQIEAAWRRFRPEPGFCWGTAIASREAVYIGSFAEWQQRYPRSAELVADGGYASAAVLPLLVEGSPIGVLSFHFTVPVNFDDGYCALLTSVAQHAAQAIDRARLYETAQRARADAEAANRSKDDFLSIVSHELRTPLSAVLGWASMLRNRTVDPERAPRAIEAIYNNATRQAHLIDELLDVSRIVAGRAPMDVQVVDLTASVRGAVEAILPVAEAKGVDVRFDPAPITIPVSADPRRLEQVFVNLLGNAVKFTPAGGHVLVETTPSEQAIDVRVTDSGRGIEAAFLPHVFERFRQGDETMARSAGGLGLGLFIARRLVEAHGGRIRAESGGEGRGASFVVSLPAAGEQVIAHASPDRLAAPLNGSPAELPSLAGLRILLVDDEEEVRDVMASVLDKCGAAVTSVASADEALSALRGSQSINVLLTDIAMPGQDGYELIRQVRALSARALLPAAAVSAFAGAHERERALSAGFQMHLAKPILPETLAHAVAKLAEIEPARGVL